MVELPLSLWDRTHLLKVLNISGGGDLQDLAQGLRLLEAIRISEDEKNSSGMVIVDNVTAWERDFDTVIEIEDDDMEALKERVRRYQEIADRRGFPAWPLDTRALELLEKIGVDD